MASLDETFGQQRREQLPWTIVARWGTPSNGRENGYSQRRHRRGRPLRSWVDDPRLPMPAARGTLQAQLGRDAPLGLDGRTGIVALRRLDALTEPTTEFSLV